MTEVRAGFASAAVSDLERRDRDVDGEKIGNKRTAGDAKFTFAAKKVVNDSWIGPGRTVIMSSLDRQSTAGITELKEVGSRQTRMAWISSLRTFPAKAVGGDSRAVVNNAVSSIDDSVSHS